MDKAFTNLYKYCIWVGSALFLYRLSYCVSLIFLEYNWLCHKKVVNILKLKFELIRSLHYINFYGFCVFLPLILHIMDTFRIVLFLPALIFFPELQSFPNHRSLYPLEVRHKLGAEKSSYNPIPIQKKQHPINGVFYIITYFIILYNMLLMMKFNFNVYSLCLNLRKTEHKINMFCDMT